MSREDGGPAFPTDRGEFSSAHEGMSLRDYFAAKAMQGLLAGSYSALPAPGVAEWSYKQADAMLAARKENDR